MANIVSKALQTDTQTLALEVVKLYREGLEGEAEGLCSEKISALLQTYSLNYVLKSCTKGYREAIYQVYYGNPFPGKKATDKERANYFSKPVSLFTPPDWVKQNSREKTKIYVDKKQDVLVKLPDSLIDKLLVKGLELLRSEGVRAKDYYAKGLALELFTGRRQYEEICFSANFEPVSDNEIYFTGLAKSKIDGIKFPVLGANALEISSCLEELKTYIQSRDWFTEETTSRDIKEKIDKIYREDIIPTHFQPIIDEYFLEVRQSYGKQWKEKIPKFPHLSTHEFRALYVCICHKRINREISGINTYAKKILGHSSDKSAKHYEGYRVVSDAEFQSWKENDLPRELR
jgi:hypothetical protein